MTCSINTGTNCAHTQEARAREATLLHFEHHLFPLLISFVGGASRLQAIQARAHMHVLGMVMDACRHNFERLLLPATDASGQARSQL